jgi:hypothetical protein
VLDFFRRIGVKPVRSLDQWIELSRSYSGYERETAVRALRSLRQGSAIPCLLVRANDWVPAVRDAAWRALWNFITDEFAGDWIAALDGVVALQRARRTSPSRLLDAVGALLGKPQHLPSTLRAAAHSSPTVRRFVFEIQCHQALDFEQRMLLLQGAISGEDVLIARRALVVAQGESTEEGRCRLNSAACQSRFSEVRVGGLRRSLASAPESSRDLVRRLSFDRSNGVRSIALQEIRYWQDEALVLGQARSQLERADASGQVRAIALQVIFVLDRDLSRTFCEQFVRDTSASLRCVAYARLLATASDEEKDRLILLALADSSSRVQRVAAESIRRGTPPPTSDVMMAIALGHGTESALNRAMSLLSYGAFWVRLTCLLRGLAEPTPAHGEAVWKEALVQWEGAGIRNFTTPSETQQREIGQLWEIAAPKVQKSLRERMSFHLSTYGIGTEASG